MPEDKVQKRINPKPWVASDPGPGRLTITLVGGVLLIVGVGASVLGWMTGVGPGVIMSLVGFILALLGVYVAGGGVPPWAWVWFFVFGLTWRRSQASAQASIVQQIAERRGDSDGWYYVYWITFRFDSSEGPVALKARVSKSQYNRLRRADRVNVRYSARNPRVALLEGEYEERA